MSMPPMMTVLSPRSGSLRAPAAMAGALGFVLLAAACGGAPVAQTAGPAAAPTSGPRIVQAGAPGEATRAYEGTSLDDVQGLAYTEADVAFMQGMIHHHAQALEMTALIPDRTTSRAIRQMGLRMEISQADEIAIMERWLRDRGLEVPAWRPVEDEHAAHGQMDAEMDHAMHEEGMDHEMMDHDMMDHAAHHEGMEHQGMDHEGMDHGAMEPSSEQASMDHDAHGPSMPGMLSPEQMASLEAARDAEFDRLFLELMIQHHEGAIVMVRELFASAGSAQESTVFLFASEVDADQSIEIRRMRQLLQAMR